MLRAITHRTLRIISPGCIKNPASHLHTTVTNKTANETCDPTPVVVVLCGCGGLDGTEISESISLAINLSHHNFYPKFFAPDMEICGVVDHLTKEPDTCGLPRNALVEGARLARSSIKSLSDCKALCGEALIIPGGFGAARTMSDFASKGAECALIPDLKRVIEEFNCEKKPIGTMCIASALVARVLEGVKVTLGKEGSKEDWPYAEAIRRVKDMGAKVEEQDVKGVTYCEKYNVYSTPAWMYSRATYHEIHQGIGNMIAEMKKKIVR
ncbi:glutamine amidotransferase-like class 1 domain-containing protein 3A, mitochondrial [Diachasma alloeum]|uniref:glutamine amidotransferase-like class 1 domain-containing protein 3A, mitochondrial n=1 Tax=Diachasma alloeum TaxID=454923 RepID=UPI000738470A|nr:glutamine amidotransferase-like class 1 domain-containing protein 3A, mitochondrial [Diachasma alloeum]